MKGFGQIYRTTLAAALLLMFFAGCTSIRPELYPELVEPTALSQFDYQWYQRLLAGFVDQHGMVDYAGLARNRADLDTFYHQIAAYSPDSHPDLFPDDNARLAYWINSYNLTTIRGVLQYYPITSVEDVAPPLLLFFLPRKSGFFFFQRFTYGGIETSLYYLENQVIRKRFLDPRYHFALNCASRSCPELPAEPFHPDRLDAQLDREALAFINDERNVRYDAQTKTFYLSSIFDWYEDDFIDWLNDYSDEHDDNAGQWQATQQKTHQTMVDYILRYLDYPAGSLVSRDRAELKIVYLPYDWGLNDVSAPKRAVDSPFTR